MAGVWRVALCRQARERGGDLRLGADAVEQPVGERLARNAQGRAILHQADIVDVGDLRAADALVDPAHDIAQYALAIIVEFARDFGFAPVAAGGDGDGKQAVQRRHRRSEEHTSELQSLMRISYAVFCSKNKNTNTSTNK